jgi:Na+-translocating ferredoxin:NAD+ oxidoreductase subunit B
MAQGSLATLQQRLNDALPQTQCTRCGYPDCASYAQAMATGEAAIDQCPPGGAEGVARLAAILGLAPRPLNPAHGEEMPQAVAVIDENWCIGCTLCIKACPTDAIVGANKRMHTVIEAYCTGCDLCLPVCPVDCIQMEVVSGERTGWAAWSPEQAALGRQRYEARQQRLERESAEHGKRAHHLGRRLHQFDQHAFARDRELLVRLGVQKGDVEAGRALADAAGRKAHALGREPFHRHRQVVDPQADVVERRGVDRRLFLGVHGLHQVDLDLEGAAADGADVFVHVLALAAGRCR